MIFSMMSMCIWFMGAPKNAISMIFFLMNMVIFLQNQFNLIYPIELPIEQREIASIVSWAYLNSFYDASKASQTMKSQKVKCSVDEDCSRMKKQSKKVSHNKSSKQMNGKDLKTLSLPRNFFKNNLIKQSNSKLSNLYDQDDENQNHSYSLSNYHQDSKQSIELDEKCINEINSNHETFKRNSEVNQIDLKVDKHSKAFVKPIQSKNCSAKTVDRNLFFNSHLVQESNDMSWPLQRDSSMDSRNSISISSLNRNRNPKLLDDYSSISNNCGISTSGGASSVSCSDDFSFTAIETEENSNVFEDCSNVKNNNEHNPEFPSNKISIDNNGDESETDSESSIHSLSSLSCNIQNDEIKFSSQVPSSKQSNKFGKCPKSQPIQECCPKNSRFISNNQRKVNDCNTPPSNRIATKKVSRKILVNSKPQTIGSSHQKLMQIPPVTEFKPKKEVEDLYFVDKSIGDGKFGVVYTCIHRSTRQSYALKVVDKRTMQQVLPNSGRCGSINTEVSILRGLQHPNIIRLFDHFDYEDQSYLVLELLQVLAFFTKIKF